MRVAVVGAGVTGCSVAWRLARSAQVASVTLLEMGRGAGGRASTRQTRDLPGLRVNHGAPLFHISEASGDLASLLDELSKSGSMAPWTGSFGTVSAESGLLSGGVASHNEPAGAGEVARYVGAPGMSSLCEGILKAVPSNLLETRNGVKVSAMKPCADRAAGRWELFDQKGEPLGSYDWVVVTSVPFAHPYWKKLTGEEPPLKIAAEASGSAALQAIVARLTEGYSSLAIHVAMLAWKFSDEVAEALRKLPYDINTIQGSSVLGKVVRQPPEGPYLVVVLHSTTEFGAQNYGTTGSKSTAANMGFIKGSADDEAAVQQQLLSAFAELMRTLCACDEGQSPLPEPSWGPVLHRWGSAFPDMSLNEGELAWVIQEEQVVLAGDFLGRPRGCIEGALRSGLAAAQGILEKKGSEAPVPASEASCGT